MILNDLEYKVCNLCNSKVSKLVDSHILPKSFYPKKEISYLMDSHEIFKRRPTGEYDQIVCDACEKRFNDWDDHGYKVLLENFHNKPVLDYSFRELKYDYKKMKLFFLSLLWRLHVSKGYLGEQVKLSENDFRIISAYIFNQHLCDWLTYSVDIQFLYSKHITVYGTTQTQKVIPMQGYKHRCYQLFTNGYRITFYCGKIKPKNLTKIHHINESGTTLIPIFPFEGTNEEYILHQTLKNEKAKKYFIK